jgi:biotin carboxyl carrier protein
MKMEHGLTAPLGGVVVEIAVAEGAQVAEAAKIMVIRAEDETA